MVIVLFIFSKEREKDNWVRIIRKEDKVRRCRKVLIFFKVLLYLVMVELICTFRLS